MRHAIEIILLDPEGLRKAVREADRQMAGARRRPQCRRPCTSPGSVSDQSRPLVYNALKNGPFQSEVTGAQRQPLPAEPDDLDTVIHDQIDTTVEAQMPLGYLIPPAWSAVAELLKLHGVEMERTSKAVEQRVRNLPFHQRPLCASAQSKGTSAVSFDAQPVKENDRDSGRILLGAAEAAARAPGMAMLEPQAPDSLARWGLMNPVFETGGERQRRASISRNRSRGA